MRGRCAGCSSWHGRGSGCFGRRFRLRGGAVAKLSPSSAMTVVAQNDTNDRPSVEKGNVSFAVPHQAPGHNFSVTAGPYRIVVIGTKFRLHVGPKDGDPLAPNQQVAITLSVLGPNPEKAAVL